MPRANTPHETSNLSIFEDFMRELTRQVFIWRMARNNQRPTPAVAAQVAHRAQTEIDTLVISRAHALQPSVALALNLLAELRAEHVPVECTYATITPHRHCKTCGSAYPWPCPMRVRLDGQEVLPPTDWSSE